MNQYILTDIKTTKKGRYALFCDGAFIFSVDEEVLVRHGLEAGQTLDDSDIELLRKESDHNRAKEKAFSLLSVRDYAEKELYNRLQRDFDSHTCAATVARLSELGLLSDDRYAQKMRDEMLRKGKSMLQIKQKLVEKGIDRELIDAVCTSVETDETDTVCGIIEGRYLRKLSEERGYSKVFAALARRGFRSPDIRRALAKYTQTEEDYYYE